MAEFIEYGTGPQTVEANSPVQLISSISCNKGYVVHRDGSGILTLRSIANNPCARFARYLVIYNGNIAIPTDGTVGEISLGITVTGEVENATISRYTPAAVQQYGSVGSARYITVPVGCCYNIAIENNSTQNILVENLNVIVIRTA